MRQILIILLLLLFTGACKNSPQPVSLPILSPTPHPSASPQPLRPTQTNIVPTIVANPTLCRLQPIIIPTIPAVIPGTYQLDKITGLHMTGTVQLIDLSVWRLKITGKVDHPMNLSFDDLRCMPKVTATPTLTCQGFFTDVTTWSGVPIKYILGLAGVQKEAKEILLISADQYKTYIPLNEAIQDDNFLAYEWKSQPLPILHGFPLRAIFPSMFGNKWAKWLVEIQVR